MPLKDADRWNERYAQEGGRYARFEQPRPYLIRNAHYLPKSGLALDLAMGLGGNAGLLLEHGLRVIGVDISYVALRQAKARLPRLGVVLADLNHFYLPPKTFDVILNFYYLQRDLWPQIQMSLRIGGILIFETLTIDMRLRSPDVDPQYLLSPGELRQAFPELEILDYSEGWETSDSGNPRAIASLVGRKVAASVS